MKDTNSNKQSHYCYILEDINRKTFTYNGYTNNPIKRLRQHNGEISGGARFTSRSLWCYFVIITSEDFDYKTALSFEWHLKYPNNKRPRPREYNGIVGRLRGLCLVMKNKKFDKLKNIVIYIRDDLKNEIESMIEEDSEITKDRIQIESLEKIILY